MDLLITALLVVGGNIDVLAWDAVDALGAVSRGLRGEAGPLERTSQHF